MGWFNRRNTRRTDVTLNATHVVSRAVVPSEVASVIETELVFAPELKSTTRKRRRSSPLGLRSKGSAMKKAKLEKQHQTRSQTKKQQQEQEKESLTTMASF